MPTGFERGCAPTSKSYLAGDIDLPDDMAEAFWLADTRSDGELGAFLAWRCTVVTSLVAEIRAAVREGRGGRGHPVGGAADRRRLVRGQRPRGARRGRRASSRPASTSRAPARVLADAWDVKRRIGGDGAIRGILRAGASRPQQRRRGRRRGRRAARGRHRRHRLLQLRLSTARGASAGSAQALAGT